MLLTRTVLESIAAGSVSLVFRRWRRPTVKTGGILQTAIGLQLSPRGQALYAQLGGIR